MLIGYKLVIIIDLVIKLIHLLLLWGTVLGITGKNKGMLWYVKAQEKLACYKPY